MVIDEIIGKKFGKRTAIKYLGSNKNGHRFLFKCECGLESAIPMNEILRGKRLCCNLCANQVNRKARAFNGNGN